MVSYDRPVALRGRPRKGYDASNYDTVHTGVTAVPTVCSAVSYQMRISIAELRRSFPARRRRVAKDCRRGLIRPALPTQNDTVAIMAPFGSTLR